PLPHHHELRQGLPEAPQPRQGHRRDQDDDGRAEGVTPVLSSFLSSTVRFALLSRRKHSCPNPSAVSSPATTPPATRSSSWMARHRTSTAARPGARSSP